MISFPILNSWKCWLCTIKCSYRLESFSSFIFTFIRYFIERTSANAESVFDAIKCINCIDRTCSKRMSNLIFFLQSVHGNSIYPRWGYLAKLLFHSILFRSHCSPISFVPIKRKNFSLFFVSILCAHKRVRIACNRFWFTEWNMQL